MTTNQRRSLVHYARSTTLKPMVIREGQTLPPREMFAAHPEVLVEYDVMANLNAAVIKHNRDTRAKRAQADQAREDYRAAVHNALTTGGNAAAVKSKAEQYDAEAKAHAQFAADAQAKARHQGHVLGAAIQAIAPKLVAAADLELTGAADDVKAALADLTASEARWADAWAARLWVSRAQYQGGLAAWHGGTVDQDITTALATLGNGLNGPDTLRLDEIQLTQWRETQRKARETNAADIGAA